MAQHFLLSAKAKSLTLAQVFRLSDAEAEAMFRKVRWSETDGEAVCPDCGGLDAYDCRRPNGAPRYRCRACKKDFSITSGTLFASHKLPLRAYLAAIAIFTNEVKGKSMLAMAIRRYAAANRDFISSRESVPYRLKRLCSGATFPVLF
jgi:transposase-like protein